MGETTDVKIEATADGYKASRRSLWKSQKPSSVVETLEEEHDRSDRKDGKKESEEDDDDDELDEEDMAAILRTVAKIETGKLHSRGSTHERTSVGKKAKAAGIVEREPSSFKPKPNTHGNKFIRRGVASRDTIVAMGLLSSVDSVEHKAHQQARTQHNRIKGRRPGRRHSMTGNVIKGRPGRRGSMPEKGMNHSPERRLSAPGNVMPHPSKTLFEDVLDEAQHYLAMSMLVYVYSQLREMSVLGYTGIPFRAIDVNKYRPFVAPSQKEQQNRRRLSFSDTEHPESGEGAEPLKLPNIEARSRPQQIPKTVLTPFNARMITSTNPSPQSSICTLEEDPDAESLVSSSWNQRVLYTYNTMSAAKVIRIVLEELENERKDSEKEDEELLEFGREHDISIMKEFRKWVDDSRVDQLDAAATATIRDLRRQVARARWKRAILVTRISVRLAKSASERKMKKERDRELNHVDDSETHEFAERVRTSLTKRRSILENTVSAKNWFKLQKRLVEDHFGLDDGGDDVTTEDGTKVEPNQCEVSQESRRLSEDFVTKDLVDNAVNQSLPSYFKKGSVLSRMINSGLEVAWFGDRHPNEAIYCICCCRVRKTVTVVFRGSVNAHNWLTNMKFMMSEHPNPLANENYDGRADRFRLHTGFGLYMLRKRRDDNQRKIDEILTKVDAIGREIASDGRYRFSVTGHSLGGALATICSFYAATDSRFTKMAPVRVFTFAAPRVGDQRFLDAYQHLEQSGKLLHARFVASCDLVPLTPFVSLNGFKVGPPYKHVGLQIRLHAADIYGKARIRMALDSSYTGRKGFWPAVYRGVINSALFNLATPEAFKRNHRLTEHQRRIHFARQLRLGLGRSEFFTDHRRRELKSLEKYYAIRANIPPRCDRNPKRGSLKPLECTFVVLFLLLSVLGTTIFGWWLVNFMSSPGDIQDHVVGTCSDVQNAENVPATSLSQPFFSAVFLRKMVKHRVITGVDDPSTFQGDDADSVVHSSVFGRDPSNAQTMGTVGLSNEGAAFYSEDGLLTAQTDRMGDTSAVKENDVSGEDPQNPPFGNSPLKSVLKSGLTQLGGGDLDGKVPNHDNGHNVFHVSQTRHARAYVILSRNIALFSQQSKGLEMLRLALRMKSGRAFNVRRGVSNTAIWMGRLDSVKGVLASRLSRRAAQRQIELWDIHCFALQEAVVVARQETLSTLRQAIIETRSAANTCII